MLEGETSDIYSSNGLCSLLNENIHCRMGIEILSFTIKDVYDNVTYLQVKCMINV